MPFTRDECLDDTANRIQDVSVEAVLKVLTDGMLWYQEGPGFSCTEAEAIAAAAVMLGADLAEMAELVVDGHGSPDSNSEDEGDDHYHTA